jgi:hypothetical protein
MHRGFAAYAMRVETVLIAHPWSALALARWIPHFSLASFWWARACRLPGRALHVAPAIWATVGWNWVVRGV